MIFIRCNGAFDSYLRKPQLSHHLVSYPRPILQKMLLRTCYINYAEALICLTGGSFEAVLKLS